MAARLRQAPEILRRVRQRKLVVRPADSAQAQPVNVAALRVEKRNNPKHPAQLALSIRALARPPCLDVGGCRVERL